LTNQYIYIYIFNGKKGCFFRGSNDPIKETIKIATKNGGCIGLHGLDGGAIDGFGYRGYGLNSHSFNIIGDKLSNQTVGDLYTNYFSIKGGMSLSPTI